MKFPKFLRILSIPRIETVKINETASISNEIFDTFDDYLTQLLSQKLGFSYKLLAPPDGAYGKLLPDGNWTGMVGMIQRKEADVILYKLAVTEERGQVLDFSNPYLIDRVVFATKNLERSINTTSFIEPFSWTVWLSLLICILLLPIVHYLLFKRSHSLQYLCFGKFFDKLEDSSSRTEYVLRTFWMLGEMFLCWSFTAVLLSFLTYPTLTGVRTISELAVAVKQGRYECSTFLGSFVIGALIDAGGDYAIIGQNLKKSTWNTYDYESVLNAKKSSLKHAFISAEGLLFKLRASYFVPDESFFNYLVSVGLKKGFCCKRKLDSLINKIWASGVLLKKTQDYNFRETYKMYQKSLLTADQKKEIPLSLPDVSGIFFLLGAGYVLALIVLIFERIFGKFGIPFRGNHS